MIIRILMQQKGIANWVFTCSSVLRPKSNNRENLTILITIKVAAWKTESSVFVPRDGLYITSRLRLITCRHWYNVHRTRLQAYSMTGNRWRHSTTELLSSAGPSLKWQGTDTGTGRALYMPGAATVHTRLQSNHSNCVSPQLSPFLAPLNFPSFTFVTTDEVSNLHSRSPNTFFSFDSTISLHWLKINKKYQYKVRSFTHKAD